MHLIVLIILHLSHCVRMRFKRKRDDVKALHATLKELQGIDPLDYLARYVLTVQLTYSLLL